MHNSLRLCLLGITLISGIAVVSGNEDSSVFKTVRNSNAAILNRLGLVPLEIPDGHHKKRLAGPEPPAFGAQSRIHQPYSRRHGHRDSHVYIVKLPATPPYYTFTKPHKSVKDDKGQKNLPSSVGFHSNGKPGKIYHWNLPLMMKIAEKKRYQTQMKMDQLKKKMQMENIRGNNDYQNRNNDISKIKGDSEIIKINSNDINAIQAISNVHTSVNDIERKHEVEEMKHFNKPPSDNGKYFHSSADNRLLYGSKQSGLQKHSRNNDKRLSYPISLEVGSKKIKEAEGYKTKNSTNKMFRLADSATYRVGVHANDHFSAWNNLSNELHGSRNTPDEQKPKKHRKKAAMSYYAPLSPKSGSTSIHKNFPGNGKPKAFYVMEKSRKPIYYHQLLP